MKLTGNLKQPQKLQAAFAALKLPLSGGYEQGYADGSAEGRQAEYDRFWDAYQNNGTETNYYQAFQNQFWDDDTFRPKYPITCKDGSTNAINLCYNAQNITNIPVDIIVTGISMQNAFSRCTSLHTIKKLVANGVTSFSGTFTACYKLANITIEGSIDVNFDISATAVLTDGSVQSIIDHLKDLTGKAAQTLTLHATVGARLTEEQKAAIAAKNWSVVY